MPLTQDECITLLEEIRWGGTPTCPYCKSTNATSYKTERRYHCNTCFNSYSVTVGTLFHKTHIELYKWLRAIDYVLSSKNKISVRQLARELKVNKNTASYMMSRIQRGLIEEPDLLQGLLDAQNSSWSV